MHFVYLLITLLIILIEAVEGQEQLLYSQQPIFNAGYSSHIQDIKVSADLSYAFIGAISGKVMTLDLKDITNPIQIFKLNNIYLDKITDMVFLESTNTLILAGDTNGILFLDTSNKKQLVWLQQFGQNLYNAVGLLLISDTKLAVSVTGGFLILDITDRKQCVLLLDQVITPGFNFNRPAITPDNQFLITGQYQGLSRAFYIYDISDTTNPTRTTTIAADGPFKCAVHPDITKKFAFLYSRFGDLFSIDYSSWYTTPQDQPKLSTWADPYISDKADIELTADGNNLLLSAKGWGVYFFDVSNPNQIILSFLLQNDGISSQITLTSQYLFLTAPETLSIYIKTTPNLNNKIPNIFNPEKSVQWYNTDQIETQPWGLVISPDDTKIFAAYAKQGMKIFDGTQLPHLAQLQTWDLQSQNLPSDFCILKSQGPSSLILSKKYPNILYTTIQNGGGLCTIDYTDLGTPVQKAYLPLGGDHDDIVYTNDEHYIFMASGYNGISVIDNSDIINPLFLKFLTFTGYSSELLCINQLNTLLISSFRDSRFKIYDIHNMNSIVEISEIITYGGEAPVFSVINPNIIYLGDNSQGLKIFDIKNTTQPVQLYKDNSGGISWKPIFSNGEQYLFLPSSDGNTITMYSIANLQQVYVQSIFKIKQENAFRLALNSANTFIVTLGIQGLRAIPLTVPLKLNTEFYIFSRQLQKYVFIDQSRGFYVGEQGLIKFTIIGDPLSKSINLIKIFLNKIQQNIPSWMQWNPDTSTISFTVNKQGVGNQLLIITQLIKIVKTDFVGTPEQQQNIFSALKTTGYLDNNGFLTNFFQSDQQINLQDPSLVSQNPNVHQVLINKFYNLIVQLFIFPSLIFNPASQTTPILTQVLTVSVALYVDLADGVFVQQSYSGVIVELNYDQNRISISGGVDQVNLKIQQIRFSQKRQKLSHVKAIIVIDDQANEIITQTLTFDKLKFVGINHLVSVKTPLQQQLNDLYPNGQAFIEEDFKFIFSQSTFEDEDPLTYSALYIDSSGTQRQLKDQTLVQFSPDDRSFIGKTKESDYELSYTYIVIASDGYSKESSQFTIQCNKIPAAVIIKYIGNIVGPLVSVIGLFVYRIALYHLFCKKKYKITSRKFIPNQAYQIQFFLVATPFKIAEEIWKAFDKKNFVLNYSDNLELNEKKFHSDIIDTIQKKGNNQENINILNNLQKLDSPEFQIVCAFANQFLLYSNKMHVNIYEGLKHSAIEKSSHKDPLNNKNFFEYYIHLKHLTKKHLRDDNSFPEAFVQTELFVKDLEIQYYQYNHDKFSSKNKSQPPNQIYLFQVKELSNIQRLEDNCPNFNYKILIKQMINDAIGINGFAFLESSRGYSINTTKTEIQAVKSFRQHEINNICIALQKFAKLDYTELEMSFNNPMPAWINLEIAKNCIDIILKPTLFDLGKYQIRIMNSSGFIDVEFDIEVHGGEEDPQLHLQSIDISVERGEFDNINACNFDELHKEDFLKGKDSQKEKISNEEISKQIESQKEKISHN